MGVCTRRATRPRLTDEESLGPPQQAVKNACIRASASTLPSKDMSPMTASIAFAATCALILLMWAGSSMHWPLCWFLAAYILAELSWLGVCEYDKRSFQTLVEPDCLSAAQRQQLWKRCLHWSNDARIWIQGWFFDIDSFEKITLPDITAWIAWAFWGTPLHQVPRCDQEQLKQMVRELEAACSTPSQPNFRFPQRDFGQDELRMGSYTLQPMDTVHIPLLLYLISHALVEMLAGFLLWRNGFVTYNPACAEGSISFSVRLPAAGQGSKDTADPGAPLTCGESTQAGGTTRPHATPQPETLHTTGANVSSATALVVIHGIGFGILSYWSITRQLLCEGPIIIAHTPCITMSLCGRRRRCPTVRQTVAAYSEVLNAFGCDGACVIAHSLGSAVPSWLLRERPGLVKGLVLLDPAVMQIHEPKLLFNFLYYKQPLTTWVGLLQSELYINHYLRRHFCWYTAALFGEDILPACESLLVFSEDDVLVPSAECSEILTAMLHAPTGGRTACCEVDAAPCLSREDSGGAGGHCEGEGGVERGAEEAAGSAWKSTRSSWKSMKVVVLTRQGHGAFLLCGTTQARLLSLIKPLYRRVSAPVSESPCIGKSSHIELKPTDSAARKCPQCRGDSAGRSRGAVEDMGCAGLQGEDLGMGRVEREHARFEVVRWNVENKSVETIVCV